MKRSELQLFALLQSGLWDRPADIGLFTGTVDWELILTLAKVQTVTGVLYDGICRLPVRLQPPTAVMRTLYLTVVRIERSHELLNSCLAEIVPQLEAEGIRPVLLKGQGVAQNYPNPLRRQCGDIDLYVGKDNCNRAMQIILDLGAKPQVNLPAKSPKHESFYWGEVSIELHFLVEKLRNPIYNKRFQQWVSYRFAADNLRTWNLKETVIHLPPTDFDAIYIFNHAFHHFITGGIGLRQLCDWAMFLHTFSDKIDRSELLKKLRAFGILKPWQVFGCIVVDYLGLPKEEFSFYNPNETRHRQRIVQDILSVGNFGFHNPDNFMRPDNYLAGKLHSFKNRLRRFYKLYPVFPKQVSFYCVSFIYTGIKQIVKDLLKI